MNALTPEIAAKLTFDAMPTSVETDLVCRSDFMESAANVYLALRIGVVMLTKSPDELAANLKAINGDDEDGADVIALIRQISDSRKWLTGFAKVLKSVEARMLIAAARFAMEGDDRSVDAAPDAELLAACAEFDRLERKFMATDFDADPRTAAEDHASAEQKRILDLQKPLIAALIRSKPETLAGHAARARCLATWSAWIREPLSADDWSADALMVTIVRDLAAAGSAVA